MVRTPSVFRFQDGTLLSYRQIIDLGIDVQGTSQDDIVTGTNAPNRIHGGAGDDTLLGGRATISTSSTVAMGWTPSWIPPWLAP
jgi:hypothetical protein